MASEDIISLSEFKADASGWIERLQHQPPIVLTQNGKGRAVVQSYEAYKQLQDSLAMLQLIAQGEADIRAGKVTPHEKVFANLRRALKAQTTKTGKVQKRRA